jgi:Domain of unknown function (DUF4864)
MMTTPPDLESQMHSLICRISAVFALAFWLASWPAQANTPLSAADEKNVRAVVQAQLKAFADDNAARAFGFAAPALQTQFGSAENFMAMVRSSYPVVYAPANVAFLKPETQDGDVIQRVQMNDQQGKAWLAVYSLQKQKDGAWRISGCVIVESRGRFV